MKFFAPHRNRKKKTAQAIAQGIERYIRGGRTLKRI